MRRFDVKRNDQTDRQGGREAGRDVQEDKRRV